MRTFPTNRILFEVSCLNCFQAKVDPKGRTVYYHCVKPDYRRKRGEIGRLFERVNQLMAKKVAEKCRNFDSMGELNEDYE